MFTIRLIRRTVTFSVWRKRLLEIYFLSIGIDVRRLVKDKIAVFNFLTTKKLRKLKIIEGTMPEWNDWQDVLFGILIWSVYSVIIGLGPLFLKVGSIYYEGVNPHFLHLIENGELFLISLGIAMSAFGKFIESRKIPMVARFIAAVLAMVVAGIVIFQYTTLPEIDLSLDLETILNSNKGIQRAYYNNKLITFGIGVLSLLLVIISEITIINKTQSSNSQPSGGAGDRSVDDDTWLWGKK